MRTTKNEQNTAQNEMLRQQRNNQADSHLSGGTTQLIREIGVYKFYHKLETLKLYGKGLYNATDYILHTPFNNDKTLLEYVQQGQLISHNGEVEKSIPEISTLIDIMAEFKKLGIKTESFTSNILSQITN